jgi:hypothetical protein
MAAYRRFLIATDRMSDADYELAMFVGILSPHGLDPGVEVGDLVRSDEYRQQANSDSFVRNALDRLTEGWPKCLETREASLEALTELEFLAPNPVVRLAKEFRSRTLNFMNVAYSSPPRSCGGASEELVRSDAEMQEARRAFVSAVWSELGVAGVAEKKSPVGEAVDPHIEYAHGRFH